MDGGLSVMGALGSRESCPLFHNRWWLDAASGAPCENVTLTADGVITGTLFYHRTIKAGMTRLRMPPFTRTLSPRVLPPPSKPAQRLANTRRIVHGLIAALPPHDLFEFALDPHDDDSVAFACEQAGATIHQTFTFRTESLALEDDVWHGLDQKTRNVIRSASRRCTTAPGQFEDFACIFRQEHGNKDQTNLAALSRLFTAASNRGQAEIRVAKTAGAGAAAILLAWDNHIMYLLATTRLEGSPGGANALLIWDAIKSAIGRQLVLDLDGYRSGSSARFLSTFGLALVPRRVIIKRSARYAAAEWVKLKLIG